MSPSLLEILLARLAERIAASSPRWSPGSCFVSETPFPDPAPALTRFGTVAPGEGEFDDAFASGGAAVLIERLSIVVTIFRQTLATPARAATNAAGESLLAEREALLALALEPWEPVHEGRALLAEPLAPRRSLAPQLHRSSSGETFVSAGLLLEAALDRGGHLL